MDLLCVDRSSGQHYLIQSDLEPHVSVWELGIGRPSELSRVDGPMDDISISVNERCDRAVRKNSRRELLSFLDPASLKGTGFVPLFACH